MKGFPFQTKALYAVFLLLCLYLWLTNIAWYSLNFVDPEHPLTLFLSAALHALFLLPLGIGWSFFNNFSPPQAEPQDDLLGEILNLKAPSAQ